MKPQFAARVLVLLALLLTMTSPVVTWAEESDREAHLSEGDFTNVSKLLRQFEEATAEKVKWADWCRRLGHRAIERGQWGAAAKAFGMAVQNRPTPRTMLVLAVADANMDVSGYTCDKAVEIKFALAQGALKYFHAGLEMHKILGSKSDLDEAAIVDFHKKMLNAQKRLLDFQRKCFSPEKMERVRN